MKLGFSSDHGGYELKKYLIDNLKEYECIDYGCDSLDSVDYPDYAIKVCDAYLKGDIDIPVLICSTGIGMSIAANKFKGIRCALVTSLKQAELTRLHNDANAIALGAFNQDKADALKYLKMFLDTKFSNEERHIRRINKIKNLEA